MHKLSCERGGGIYHTDGAWQADQREVPNTARQLAILDRLGCPRPVFAHIPMILSMNRQKLSKRTGSTSIREYRERGFLPEGLVAYLATLSWSSGDAVSPFSLESLAGAFSLDRISRSSPLHDELEETISF